MAKSELNRVQLEAYALRRVLDLEAGDRLDACEKLDRAAVALPAWLGAVRREIADAPAADLRALWAVLDRPGMMKDRAALEAAAVNLDALLALDPAEARNAYAAAIQGTKEAGERRSMESAAAMLAEAMQAGDAAERKRLRAEALTELTRAARDAGGRPIAETWEAYRAARFTRMDAGPDEVLRLDEGKRGKWAAWFNCWLGPRRGLEAGRCMMVGARSGAGKTSLAAVLAVDAMAAGVPVLFWQLELSREGTVEHLLSQMPGDTSDWWNDYWTKRCNRPLPDHWADLLTVPPVDGPEAYEADTIREAMQAHAARAGKVGHACKGLVIVDYAQLLTVRDRRASTPQHELLTKAASMLTKAAADLDLCLLLLSQMRKADQDSQSKGGQFVEGTAFSGADLNRVADVSFALSHFGYGKTKDGKDKKTPGEVGARDVIHGPQGQARVLARTKDRGFAKLNGKMPPLDWQLWVSDERALHSGTDQLEVNPEDIDFDDD